MRRKINDIFTDIEQRFGVDMQSPGYVCLIQDNDKHVYTRSIGVERVQSSALSLRSSFRIASITKQCTAVAILQLAEKAKLSIDAKVIDVLPDFPPYAKEVTIHHLLTHTAGIRDYEASPVAINLPHKFLDTDVLEVLKQFNDLEFTAGSNYHYSNGGYCLLALIVARVSGCSYAEYVKQNIFDAVGMECTQVGTKPDIRNRVYGYVWSKGCWTPCDQDIFTHTEGDGGVYASVVDLAKWQAALYSTKNLLSGESLQLMTTRHTPTNYSGEDYGYGIAITAIDSSLCYLHHGVSSGFENALLYLPREQLTIALLSNMRHQQFNAVPIVKQVAAEYVQIA